ncbi:MAG: GIY-YIG nuclease family protein [Candidatus Omnitrophica bacterium]|nr:GIY-YIG nuclease family protein [Candidatus Omnitrophota bacterium]
MSWCVYVLECANGDLYTGITGDLQRRFKQHQSGNGGKFTRTFGAKEILYFEKSSGRSQALKREFEIKSLSRKKKLELVSRKLL